MKELFLTPYGIIIVICVVVYFLPNLLNIPVYQFQSLGFKSNIAIANGELYRLITAVFLHGSLIHLFVNMYSLYNVSQAMMYYFGAINKNPNLVFIIVFLVAGICGNLMSYYFNSSNSLGASGAVFGIIGAIVSFAILKNQTSILNNTAQIIFINIAIGFMPGLNIDNYGHIGGLIGGIVVGALFIFL